MSSQYILTLTAMPSHVASSQHYEVPGDSWGMAIIVLLACWVCWFKCKCLRPRNCSEREWREEASWGMQSQNTSEVIVKCVSAIVELQATALETPVSSSAFEDDAGDACGVNSSAQEWQLVCLPEGQLSLATMPAAYSYTVPPLPHAAPAMASDIVRFVEFVPGDRGRHFVHNVALHMCCDKWVFFGNSGDTGTWRPGSWTWQKQEKEVITLTYARKEGIELKTRSFERNALGWYVTNSHTSACDTKVLYLLPPATLA